MSVPELKETTGTQFLNHLNS